MINTSSFNHTSPVMGGGPHSVYSNDLSPANWRTAWNTPSSRLKLRGYFGVGSMANRGGIAGQLNMFVYLRDRATGTVFAFVLGI